MGGAVVVVGRVLWQDPTSKRESVKVCGTVTFRSLYMLLAMITWCGMNFSIDNGAVAQPP